MSAQDASPDQRIIEIVGLVKKFGRFTALDRLDLYLNRGEVLGFLGPNGAGKSTTMRVLLGLLHSDAGHVTVLGQDPWKDAVSLHRRLAYVPGDVSLWPTMTGGEAIDLLAQLRGGLNQQRRKELIERFELDPTKRGRQYSKGNRQKVALVAALASDVELLLLDEPTSGLDPLMEETFQQVIREAKSRGVSILLSSHIMSEVENLADRVAIIRHGRIIRSGTLTQLRHDEQSLVRATLLRAPQVHEWEKIRQVTADTNLDGLTAEIRVHGTHLDDVVGVLASIGARSLTIEPPSLEHLFLQLYQDQSAGVR